jgi:hypothetical protein
VNIVAKNVCERGSQKNAADADQPNQDPDRQSESEQRESACH